MKLPRDFVELLEAFAARGVRYLLVGGYAVTFHSRPRSTKDIDLWVDRSPRNLRRLLLALEDFGAPPEVLEAVPGLKADEILYFGRPPLRVDILGSIPGVSFDDAFARSVDLQMGGTELLVIALDDLIANKVASGRPQDKRDVAVLRRAREASPPRAPTTRPRRRR